MQKTKWLATSAILFTVFIWGLSFISIKFSLKEIPPMTLALIRFVIATPILLFFAYKKEKQVLHRKDLVLFTLSGFLGITLYFYFENTGVGLTTVANASLIIALIPIISIPLEMMIWRTKVTLLQWTGVILSIAGAYLVVTAQGGLKFSQSTFAGNLLMFGACFSWVLYNFTSKPLLTRYSGLFVCAYQNLFGTLLILPFSLREWRQIHTISGSTWVHVLFLALFCSALGYFLYIYALNHLGTTATVVSLNLIPLIGVVAGVIFLKETLVTSQIIGGAVILLSILFVNLNSSYKSSS